MHQAVSRLNSKPPRIPWTKLYKAALSRDYANELMHPLYRYPGSMSPILARCIIRELSRPGDTVLDPFCGGGTTAIESIANQRKIICADLNPLACFITKTKTYPISKNSFFKYAEWIARSRAILTNKNNGCPVELVARSGKRFAPSTHGLLLLLRNLANQVDDNDAREYALLTVLKIGQICFDRRNNAISPHVLKNSFATVTRLFYEKMQIHIENCQNNGMLRQKKSAIKIIQTDALNLPALITAKSEIALILTSPPYPGTHILYHRWQVYARWETDLPYHLLGIDNRNYESHYTLGHRNEPGNANYFLKLGKIFSQLSSLISPSTVVAQVVAFSRPEKHIVQFREMMAVAGYKELRKYDEPNFIVKRSIPHRRWYAQIAPKQESSMEFLFLHKIR